LNEKYKINTTLSIIILSIAFYQDNVNHHTQLGKYLGFPMLSDRIKNDAFAYNMDRVNSRLDGWKTKLLSQAGSVTLAQSLVSALPTYYMQNLWNLEGNHIDASIRHFIWGRKHRHWVNWKVITQPKSRGGLGIRKARASNISILGKHVWELIHNPDNLWVNLLSSKYLHGISIL